jgi:protoporphyrinogen IX oxidase
VTTFLKFVHLATIAVWSGGLLVLPLLFYQRQRVTNIDELESLHRVTRFVYVVMTSPAAFVAIGSGTALIFLQTTFREWFSLKMVLVGAMAMLHVLAGLTAVSVFAPGGRFGRAAFITLSSIYLLLIVAILWVVLAKPGIDANDFAPHLFDPGVLGDRLRQLFGDTRTPTP